MATHDRERDTHIEQLTDAHDRALDTLRVVLSSGDLAPSRYAELDADWEAAMVDAHVLLAERSLEAGHYDGFVQYEQRLEQLLLIRHQHILWVPGQHLTALASLRARASLEFGDVEIMGRLNMLVENDTPNGDVAKGVMQTYVENGEDPTAWINTHCKSEGQRLTAWLRYHEAACENNQRYSINEVGNALSREHIMEVVNKLQPSRPEDDVFELNWQFVCMQLLTLAPAAYAATTAVQYMHAKTADNLRLFQDVNDCCQILRFAAAVARSPFVRDDNIIWLTRIEDVTHYTQDKRPEPDPTVHLELKNMQMAAATIPFFADTAISTANASFSDSLEKTHGNPKRSGALLEAAKEYLKRGALAPAVEIVQSIPAHKTWAVALLEFCDNEAAIYELEPRGDQMYQRLRLYAIALHLAHKNAEAAAVSLQAFSCSRAELLVLKMSDGQFIAECFTYLAAFNRPVAIHFFESTMDILLNEDQRRHELIEALCSAALALPQPYVEAAPMYRSALLRHVSRVAPTLRQLTRLVQLAKWTNPNKIKTPQWF